MPTRPSRLAATFLLSVLTLSHADWVSVGPQGPVGEEVDDLMVHGSHLYAVIGRGGVYRSTDFGATWASSSVGTPRQEVMVLAAKDTTLFVGGLDGAFRSRDQGKTWTPINKGLTTETAYSFTFLDNAIFTGGFRALYKTLDGGDNWTTVPIPASGAIYWTARSATSLFVGGAAGVMRSRDKGITWDTVAKFTLHPIVPDTGSNTVFLSGGLASLSRSLDDGKTWKDLPVPWKAKGGSPSALIRHGNLHFAGVTSYNTGGLYYTPDLGDTWTKVDYAGLQDTVVYSLAIQGDFLFAGTDSGRIFRRPLSEVLIPGSITPPTPRLRARELHPGPLHDAAGRLLPGHHRPPVRTFAYRLIP